LAGRAELTHVNLNDGVCEGIRVLGVPAFGVQYHPEAGPGPHDSRYLFQDFASLMAEHRGDPAFVTSAHEGDEPAGLPEPDPVGA
jgi:carbamoylphosphate synthase small subunit